MVERPQSPVGSALPRVLVARWFGHGDLTVLVDDVAGVLLRADQVERLAGIPPWSQGATLIEEQWHVHAGHEFYRLDDAVARCEAVDGEPAVSFLAWLSQSLGALLEADVLDAATRVPGFIGSSTVAAAARVLSDATGLQLTVPAVFEVMCDAGWVVRGASGDWEPCRVALTAGLVTTRDVTVPASAPVRRARSRTYRQVYVTPAGVEALRVLLADAPSVSDAPRLRPLF